MTTFIWLQISLYLIILLLFVKPVGAYMAHVFQGERTLLSRVIRPVERLSYRIAHLNEEEEMNWKTYAFAMLIFNLLGFVILFILLLIQSSLPLNPQNLQSVRPDLAFNTAVSFVTNTNWQSYSGETTISFTTQMLGLTVQNFLSAATGIAILLALIRGFI
ncbi:MAG: potassium-transporting ATPase subunit KdpA, partial [Chloroflexi bacterium]|nr:potassium-transporting ATPase subunit KdpA [Chloroflexota bacterium]